MKIFIYSRKSKWTGRGESVENQVQMCREYIERNIEGARDAEIEVYEDEGYSGKNTNRPEFQRMMKKMKAGDCGYLVCYKLDRIGRNIIDIASLVEELNKLSISFISIKKILILQHRLERPCFILQEFLLRWNVSRLRSVLKII